MTAVIPLWYVMEALRLQRELYLNAGESIRFVFDEPYAWLGEWLDPVFHNYPYAVYTIPEVTHPGMDYELSYGGDSPNVLWAVTSQSISHSPATKAVRDKGDVWVISNPDITPDWLQLLSPCMPTYCQNTATHILAAIPESDSLEVHLTSEGGTDLWLWLPRDFWRIEAGGRTGSMTCGVFGELMNIPYRAKGRLVLEPGSFVTNPINCIEHEIVLNFGGSNKRNEIYAGAYTQQLVKLMVLEPGSLMPAEFSLGLNPAKPETLYRSVVAEKLAGSFHIALGTPVFSKFNERSPDFQLLPPYWKSSAHVDFIGFNHSCTINDVQILDQGRLIIT